MTVSAPSVRRPQIESMLLGGMSFKAIAVKLKLKKGTVLWYAQQIYKQHAVRTLRELLLKHEKYEHIPRKPPLNQIDQRILAGMSCPSIANELNVPRMTVYNRRQMLRKKGIKLTDAREHNRVGKHGAAHRR